MFGLFGDKFIDYVIQFIEYFKFWRVIPSNKMGVRLRLGKNPKVLKPGIHLVFPFEIDNVKTCIVKEEWMSTLAIHITTLDLKTITVCPTIKYTIRDVIIWLYEVNDAPTNLHEIVRLCTSQVLTDCSWEDCMKKPKWTDIKNKIKNKTAGMGIEIEDFGLIDLAISRLIITSVNQ